MVLLRGPLVRSRLASFGWYAGVLALAAAAGAAITVSPEAGIGVAGGSAYLGVFIWKPAAGAALAVPGVLLYQRIPIGPTISVSDVLLAAGAVAATPPLLAAPTSPALQAARRWALVYFAALIPSLALHHPSVAVLEWLHRVVLVLGALAVGALVARERLLRPTVLALLLPACGLALVAVLDVARNGGDPAYPLGYHKNFAGSVFAMLLVLVLTAGPQLHLGGALVRAASVVLAAGLLATQSRGALLGAVTAFFVWFFATHREVRSRSWRFGAVLALGFLAFSLTSIHEQVTTPKEPGSSINSLTQRADVEAEARRLWRTEPVLGVGIRYFKDPRNAGPLAQPANNAVDEALAEGGLVAAAGLVVFLLGVLVTLLKAGHPLAITAGALVAGRLMHGMFDIYWSAGTSVLPWIVAGAGLTLARGRGPAQAGLPAMQR